MQTRVDSDDQGSDNEALDSLSELQVHDVHSKVSRPIWLQTSCHEKSHSRAPGPGGAAAEDSSSADKHLQGTANTRKPRLVIGTVTGSSSARSTAAASIPNLNRAAGDGNAGFGLQGRRFQGDSPAAAGSIHEDPPSPKAASSPTKAMGRMRRGKPEAGPSKLQPYGGAGATRDEVRESQDSLSFFANRHAGRLGLPVATKQLGGKRGGAKGGREAQLRECGADAGGSRLWSAPVVGEAEEEGGHDGGLVWRMTKLQLQVLNCPLARGCGKRRSF